MGLHAISSLLQNHSEVRFSFNLPLFLSSPCVWSGAQSCSYSTKVFLSHSPFASWLLQSRLISTPAHALWYRYCSALCHMFLSQNVKRFALWTHRSFLFTCVSTVFCCGAKHADNAAFSMCPSIDCWLLGKRADCMNIRSWFILKVLFIDVFIYFGKLDPRLQKCKGLNASTFWGAAGLWEGLEGDGGTSSCWCQSGEADQNQSLHGWDAGLRSSDRSTLFRRRQL